MISENMSLLMDKINDAELVLVGAGEEFAIDTNDASAENIVLKNNRLRFYQKLEKLLHDKNYFIVSLCTDGLIRECDFNKGRIVEPCGNNKYLQCSEKCTTDLYDIEDDMKICPKCGKPLINNRITDAGGMYVEEGYLEDWKIYTKWLQGTVNRRVCILELGVGMQFPSVIRFPFEKIVYFNQKASFFRVHSRLYQLAEEINEKSYSIQATPEDMLKELSNMI